MKKIIALICTLFIFILPAFYVSAENSLLSSAGARAYVVDDAGLLSDGEEQALLEKINSIRDAYAFDIVIHTTNDIGYKTIVEYADDYYDYNGYGVGSDYDGLIFMLNMGGGVGNRDYYTSTCGFGLTAFTDYAIYNSNSCINKAVVGHLINGDYYKAFDRYLELADEFLKAARAGTPYDYSNRYISFRQKLVYEAIVLVISAVIAAAAVFVMKSKMNNAIKRSTASEYIKDDSSQLLASSQVLVNTRVDRKPKAPPPSAGTSGRSSGGGSHTSSSGRSHGGGGGKF